MSSPQQTALLLDKAGKPPALYIGTRPIPSASKGEILIKIHTAALNPVDVFVAETGAFVKDWPIVLGYDGAGYVQEIGEGVMGFEKGDRVTFYCGFTVNTLQEYVVVNADVVAKIPSSISLEQASSVSLTLMTAVSGLFCPLGTPHGGAGLTPPWREGGKSKYANEPIVVLGGATNVGRFVIQLAKLSGFNPIITSASSHNEAYCKAAGATHVIDYRQTPYGPAFASAIKVILDPTTPLRFIYDSVTSEESQVFGWSDILAAGGKLIVATPFTSKTLGPAGVEDEDGRRVVSAFEGKELLKELFGVVEGLLRDGDISPGEIEVMDGGLNGVAEGLKRLSEKKVSGKKLVVRIGDTAKA